MALEVVRHGDVTRLRMSSMASRSVGLDVSAYVIRGVMIDTGFHHARRALLAAARSLGVRGVILTHAHEDHAGNATLFVAQGMPVSMRADTEAVLRERPAIQFYRHVAWGRPPALRASPERFTAAGVELIHTPGHSADHQVVWDRETGTLFSGDLWLGVRARILHITEDPYQILESLRIARALSAARMFDAHRGLVPNPNDAISAKIDWLGEMMETIAGDVRSGLSDRDIVRQRLGGEEAMSYLSHGDYSRRNLVKAVRRKASR